MKAIFSRAVRIAVLGAALFASGCPFSTDPGPDDPDPTPDLFKARSSVENLLHNLKQAYLKRDVAQYDSLLAQDFEFYFAEEDAIASEKLTRFEEIQTHRNMFNSSDVSNINISFTDADLTEDTTKPDPKYPERYLWTMTIINVDLTLTASRSGEDITYVLEDGTEQFWFREEAWKATDGKPAWTIVQWKELSELTP